MDSKHRYVEEIIKQFNHLKVQRRKAATHQKVGRGAGFVLTYLYNQDENVIPSEIGRQMNVSTPRVTAILNKLEAKNLIIRTISPEDRRNVFITLSEQGRQIVEEKKAQQEKNIQTLVERLKSDDVEAFIRVLKEIDTIIEQQGWGF